MICLASCSSLNVLKPLLPRRRVRSESPLAKAKHFWASLTRRWSLPWIAVIFPCMWLWTDFKSWNLCLVRSAWTLIFVLFLFLLLNRDALCRADQFENLTSTCWVATLFLVVGLLLMITLLMSLLGGDTTKRFKSRDCKCC